MKILCTGPYWRGSNAAGLFRAFSRNGSIIEVLDEFYFISLRSKNTLTKVVERLIRKRQMDEFNKAIIDQIALFRPDVLFIYKGAFVYPATLRNAKAAGCYLALFYPDVSLLAHGSNIPESIPIYDIIFTTKTFGIRDLHDQFNFNNAHFIPHGFDPDIHRKLEIGQEEHEEFDCDVSFIGTYSPKKEATLNYLKENFPNIKLKIWGDQWNRSTSRAIAGDIKNKPVLGDLYATAIQCSTINLGILSEQVNGASAGDLITSRTFHIPACGGFMLHERNEESILYYQENKEVVYFSNEEEMVQKIHYYLGREQERQMISEAGYERAISEHSLVNRAFLIMQKLKSGS
jgi:glycosyltransferase involved in cell wall biosynthesis